MVRALFVEQGYHVSQTPKGGDIEFEIRVPAPLDLEIKSVVRLCFAAPTQETLEELGSLIASGSANHVVCLSTYDVADLSTGRVSIVPPDMLLSLLTQSSYTMGEGTEMVLSDDAVAVAASWDARLDALVNPSLRWLTPLAFNKKPPELRRVAVSANRAFERVTFKAFMEVFALLGESWGEREPGKPLPDGWIGWEAGAALYDCKAASAGYVMDADDWRKFIEYASEIANQLKVRGIPVTHVVVLSSFFPGREGRKHPVYNRYTSLMGKTGLRLSYVRAKDLALFGRELDRIHATPIERRAIGWDSILEEPLVITSLFNHASRAIEEARI